jgi:hypothetical protein
MLEHQDSIPAMGAAGRRLAVDVFNAHTVATGMLDDMGIPHPASTAAIAPTPGAQR